MASDFQSSFIPKDSKTQDAFKKSNTGFLGFLSLLLFIISILAAGGLFFYKKIVKDQIKKIQVEIAAIEQNVNKDSINEMIIFSKRLEAVKNLVAKHKVASNFLDSLASSTVSNVFFTSLNYGSLNADGLSVNMNGKASSYAAIALQESIFAKNKYWKSVSFSNLSLEEKGLVSFDLSVVVDPEIAIYSPKVNPDDFSRAQNTPALPADDLNDLSDLEKDISGL